MTLDASRAEGLLREVLDTFVIARGGPHTYVADMPRPSLEDGFRLLERIRALLSEMDKETP